MSASTNQIDNFLNKEGKDKKPVVPIFDCQPMSLFSTFLQEDTDEITTEEFLTTYKKKFLVKNYLQNGKLYLEWFDHTEDNTKATKAFDFFKKAADEQNPEAQYLLGICYEKGIGVAKNKKLAIEWYDKAARNGQDTTCAATASTAAAANPPMTQQYAMSTSKMNKESDEITAVVVAVRKGSMEISK